METNKPNDEAKKLEQIKRERLKEAARKSGKYKGEEEQEENETPDNEENQEKDEKKLDNNQNNDYIVENDEEEDKIQNIIDKNFNGDVKKLGKSYLESQREFTRLYNETKEKDKFLNSLNNVLEKNPKLKQLIEKAEQGEDVESLLDANKEESKDKPTETSKSKLETSVKESDLVEAGYLDDTYLNNLTQTERDAVVRQAKLKYMEEQLPNRIAQQAAQKYQEQIDEMEKQRKKQDEQNRNKQITKERYEEGIVEVVEEYGLDFAGNEEHRKLLEEIEKRAVFFPDYNNPNVIRKDAIKLATKEVLSENGMLEEAKAEAKKKEEEIKATGFNANRKQPAQKKPTTIAEKLQERRAEKYKRGLQSGIPQRKEEVLKIN